MHASSVGECEKGFPIVAGEAHCVAEGGSRLQNSQSFSDNSKRSPRFSSGWNLFDNTLRGDYLIP